MKILQIEDFFHPEAGYQINVISKYFVKFGHEVIIVTSKMEKIPDGIKGFFGVDNLPEKDQLYEDKYKVQILRQSILCYISGRAVFDKSIFRLLSDIKPDVVMVHDCDSYIGIKILQNYRKRKWEYGLIMDSHMLRMASQNPFSGLFHRWYKVRIAPILVKNNITVIRTQDDDFVEKELGVPLSQAPWISFGSDMTLFHPDKHKKKSFKEETLKNRDAFVVVYAGKMDETKGGMFLAEALKETFDSCKEIVFVIVGTLTGEYGQTVEKLLKESRNKILRYPTQKYEELAYFFQIADLVVFPKQCSLSFYDAQACGAPVLSENNHINLERCSHGNGRNFKAGNVQDFRAGILKFTNMSDIEYKQFSDNAYEFISKNYNYETKSREYERLMLDVVNRN